MKSRSKLEEVEHEVKGLARESFVIEETDIDWPVAVAGGLAIGIPLFVGIAVDEGSLGLMAAIGALNVGLVIPARRRSGRWQWGLIALLGTLAAAAVSHFAYPSIAAIAIVTGLWLAAFSSFRVAGALGTGAGFVIGVMMVVLGGLPPQPLAPQLLAILAGAALAFALMLTIGALSKGRRTDEPDDDYWPGFTRLARASFHGLLADRKVRAHAIRLGVISALTVVFYRAADISYGYWITLTCLAVLQPDPHDSRVRSFQRAAGTIAGVLVVMVVTVFGPPAWVVAAAATVCGAGLFAIKARNYYWLVMLITPTVLLMLTTVDANARQLVFDRLVNTTIGVLVVLIVTLAWRARLERQDKSAEPVGA